MSEEPDLVELREAVKEFGHSRATILRLIRRGLLTAYKRVYGRTTWVDRAELRKFKKWERLPGLSKRLGLPKGMFAEGGGI